MNLRHRCIAFFVFVSVSGLHAQEVTVGSKKFTESVILGELLAHLARDAGADATHRKELGGTRVLWSALLNGDIDAYVEYTGTLREELLAAKQISSDAELRAELSGLGIRITDPLGFNNTYAIAMREARAEKLGVRTISDLARYPDLVLGFGNEFLDRDDGWPSLRRRYSLPHARVQGMDHDLAYRGLEGGAIDVIDAYSTDAEIAYYGLRTLRDDRAHFPSYHAVVLYRAKLEESTPSVVSAFQRLPGRISEAEMIAMNARVKIERVSEPRVAAEFLAETLSVRAEVVEESRWDRLVSNTAAHLMLVAISLGAAILAAIPLGIAAAKNARFGQVILAVVGVVQTVPTLALLVFMIPLLGIGAPAAVSALFLYSLLPIVRSTHAGLRGTPAELQESAVALGLSPGARLWSVELPMASRSILAGIKTAAVINVGTATLGALIGAGGFGQPILTGIRLDDVGLILEGAVPAAVLALLVQFLFDGLERFLLPRGLRLEANA